MTDERLEQIVGSLLRAGVILSAAVVAVGGAWHLAENGSALPAYQHFRSGPRGPGALAALPRPLAVILIGLLILIATPVARVIFSLAAFALERDRVYVAFTVMVLAVLVYGLTGWR